MFVIYFFFIAFSINSHAFTHPSCVEPSTLSASSSQKPSIDFSNKKELEKLQNQHRLHIQQTLINANLSPHIAKHAKGLKLLEKPVSSYKSQPESNLTINSYTNKFLNRLPNAIAFMNNNMEDLKKAEKQFGVDKEVIVALMLIESNFGEYKGSLNILNALFTMSHPLNSSRTSFFTNELISSFKLLTSQNYYFRKNAMGSWAGAMGYVQFIPSSVLAYAIDGNGDGKIDIINNRIDAIFSAGNYLKNAKWEKGKAILEELPPEEALKINPCTQNEQPYKKGTLVLGQIKGTERYFITYNNYNALQRWNKSFLFAYTVHTISQKLKKSHQ